MLLFIGGKTTISAEIIIAIVDYDYFSDDLNKEYIDKAWQDKKVIDATDGSMKKSLIITSDKIYISSIAALTLKKRADKADRGQFDINCLEEI